MENTGSFFTNYQVHGLNCDGRIIAQTDVTLRQHDVTGDEAVVWLDSIQVPPRSFLGDLAIPIPAGWSYNDVCRVVRARLVKGRPAKHETSIDELVTAIFDQVERFCEVRGVETIVVYQTITNAFI